MTNAAKKALDALDPRQRKAAIKHASGISLPQAMLAAGYSPKYANAAGPTHLKENERFMGAVYAIAGPPLSRAVSNAERCIEEMAALAYSDMADGVSFDGKTLTVKSFDDMPPHFRRCIRKLKAKMLPTSDEPGAPVSEIEIELHGKAPQLRNLAQIHGILDPENKPLTININFPAADDAREIMARFSGQKNRRIVDVDAQPGNGNGKSNGNGHASK